MAITDLLNAIFGQNIDCKIERPALNKLFKDIYSEREIKILELRFGLNESEPKTLKFIAELFGISRERVRQIEADAIRKLRHPRNKKRLLKPIEGKIEMNTNLFEYSVEDLLSLDLDKFVNLLSENQKLCPSVRLGNFLETLRERNYAQTVGDLVKLSKEELLKFRNFGIKTFHELEDILIELELGLWSNKKFNLDY